MAQQLSRIVGIWQVPCTDFLSDVPGPGSTTYLGVAGCPVPETHGRVWTMVFNQPVAGRRFWTLSQDRLGEIMDRYLPQRRNDTLIMLGSGHGLYL